MVLFKFRSGTHGLNEELHVNGNRKNILCFVIVSVKTCTLGMLMHLTVLLEMIFFIGFNGIINNGFNLKSPYEKTRFIFDQSIWECNGHWFLNIKAFCVIFGTIVNKNFILKMNH